MPSNPLHVGVLGHGRFGAALCDLLESGGLRAGAWDPRAFVPEERSVGGVPALVAGARFVFLATPVEAQRRVLESIRPLLTSEHIVVDVGSVKVLPEQRMAEILGAEIPWVATHPLFGPASLARGERPLRVVVCPSLQHPSAVNTVRDLYARLGCMVIEQESEAHDRAMAEAHALGFFIAKGLLDTGATFESEVVPPSAQGLARLIRAVRVDAGHLLGTLNRENPFAARLRKELISALASLDEALCHGSSDAPEVEPDLQIPDLGERSPELQKARELIDQVDHQLLSLLAQRARLARRAGAAKESIGAQVRDPRRETAMREERRRWAEELGLDPEGADAIFGAILRASRSLQLMESSQAVPGSSTTSASSHEMS